jgi:predicted secreted protein
MPSNAVAGVGTIFQKWSLTTFTWEHIAEINSITGPGNTREQIDVTSLDSTGGYREFIGSFRDGGTVALGMNFTRATYEAMLADFESNVVQNYEICLPDTDLTTIEFAGFVTELPLSITPDDKITADVTIKVSGQPVMNSGSGSGHGTSVLH